jgi:hypothetical protein
LQGSGLCWARIDGIYKIYDTLAEFTPGEEFGPIPRRPTHRPEQRRPRQKLFNMERKIGTASSLQQKPFLAVAYQIGSRCSIGGQNRKTARHGFQQNMTKALCQRGEDEQVGIAIRLKERLLADRRAHANRYSRITEQRQIIHGTTAQCQFDSARRKVLKGFQQISDSFSLA